MILLCIDYRSIGREEFRELHVTPFQINGIHRSLSCMLYYYGPLVPTEPQLLRYMHRHTVSMLVSALDYSR